MPALIISTNVSLDGVDTSSILSEATSEVAKLIGKPANVSFVFIFVLGVFFSSLILSLCFYS
jgi:phenylpyruvate tautomerase